MSPESIGSYVMGTFDAAASMDILTRGAQQNLINQLVYMYNTARGGTPQFKVAPSAEELASMPQTEIQAAAQQLFQEQTAAAEKAMADAAAASAMSKKKPGK